MEEREQELVQQLVSDHARFRMLYEEHSLLEKELDSLNSRGVLTAEEEMDRKKVQKLKLAGKDEMERIMREFRA